MRGHETDRQTKQKQITVLASVSTKESRALQYIFFKYLQCTEFHPLQFYYKYRWYGATRIWPIILFDCAHMILHNMYNYIRS